MALNPNYRKKSYIKATYPADAVEIERKKQLRNNHYNQISVKNSLIEVREEEIVKLQREMERIEEFESSRKAAWAEFQSELQGRQSQIQKVYAMRDKCVSASKYVSGMDTDLTGSEMTSRLDSIAETFTQITKEKEKREERIRELKNQIGSLENEIVNLYRAISNL